MRNNTISGVRIRPYRKEDLKVLNEIRNNLDIQVLLMTHPRPSSLEKTKKWVENKSKSDDSVFFVITDQDDEALGFIQAARIDTISRSCYAGVAIHPEFQGNGVFKPAYDLFEIYMKRFFNIRKFLVEILSENSASIKAFTNVGFLVAGVLKSHYYQDHNFLDVVIMEKVLA